MSDSTFGGSPAPTRGRWLHGLRARALLPWLATLKARLALGALTALFAGIALTLWHMSDLTESQLLQQATLREHSVVRQMAAVVGHRVARLQQALAVTGAQMDRPLLDQPARLNDFLNSQLVLRAQYANIFVADAAGRVRLLADDAGARPVTLDIHDRDYFKQAMATGRPVISEPLGGRVSNEPVIMFVQPLVDARGTWGLVGGALRLASRDLIEDLVEAQDGDEASILVITDDVGRILAHPQRALISQELDREPRLASAAVQWRREGRPLIRDAGAWPSETDVIAMAGEPATGWHVWRATSRAALLAPMHAARRSALHIAVVTAFGLAALLALYLAWQLQPLQALERRAEGLLQGDESDVWPEASGEIGSLARTLRHVWAERTQADRFNAHIMQKLSSVMGASPVGLAFLRHGRFELFSAECCRMLGYQEEDLVGQPAARIFEDELDFNRMQDAAHASFHTGINYEGEWRLRTATGDSFWARIRSRPVVAGEPESGSIWSLYNIDEQIESRHRLEHAALHDPLTGLFNRKGFASRLQEAFAHRDDPTPATVVLLDLDHFKPVNDIGGHAAGDAMLKLVAQTLARCVRASDSVARVGGDEFAILLPGCPASQAQAVLEKVQAGISAIRLHWEGHAFGIGASLGLAERAPAHEHVDAWLADADRACYGAKHAGRGAIRVAPRVSEAAALEALDAGI